MSAFETAKKFLWPHTLVPIAAMLAIDYIKAIGAIAQVFLSAYLCLQLFSFVLGFAAQMFAHFSPSSPWATVFKYNLVNFFPLIIGGKLTFEYLMTEMEAEGYKPPPQIEEFWCRDCGTGNDQIPPDHTMDCETRVKP